MKRIKTKRSLFVTFILSIVLMFPALLSAQNLNSKGTKSTEVDINPVKTLTQKLDQKVSLTKNQKPKVMKVLRQYETSTYEAKGDKEDVQDATNDAKEDISDILNNVQKNEWKGSMADWWNSVDKELNLSDLNMNKNKNNM